MRNDELFIPGCPNKHADKLVMGYVMRGLLDKHGAYYPADLLARQHAIYEEWRAAMREIRQGLTCGFYEWLSRGGDAAFVFKPGDLVKYRGHYCVVAGRETRGVAWRKSWRLRDGMPVEEPWPDPVREVELKDSDGKVSTVDVLGGSIEPADIPPEIFALACGKAKGCPMMKGGTE